MRALTLPQPIPECVLRHGRVSSGAAASYPPVMGTSSRSQPNARIGGDCDYCSYFGRDCLVVVR